MVLKMSSPELRYQKQIVDGIKADGGFAFKMSNKFLVGVPDLFVKPRNWDAHIFEVKQQVLPKITRKVLVTMTALQAGFLRNLHDAGFPCGCISILRERADRIRLHIRFCQEMERGSTGIFNTKYHVDVDDYVPVSSPREAGMIEAMDVFFRYNGWDDILEEEEQ